MKSIDIKLLVKKNKELRQKITQKLVKLGFEVYSLMDEYIKDEFNIEYNEDQEYQIVLKIPRTIICHSIEDIKKLVKFTDTAYMQSKCIIPKVYITHESYEPEIKPNYYHLKHESNHPNLKQDQNRFDMYIEFVYYISLK